MLRKVEPFELVWQQARDALIAIDFHPLVTIGEAEHWVRDSHRCILYPDDFAISNGLPCDQVKLKGAAFVAFATDGDNLFASVS